MPKQRLDVRLHALGLSDSREQGRRLIMAGEVTVDGETVDRPSTAVRDEAHIALKRKPRFVSRGGEKLDAALTAFGLNVTGWVCADLGASTGGFTDVLLQRGAARVYALDVGHGILDYRLRIDPRVVVMEKVNARYQPTLAEPVQLVTIDASFISLKLLLPVARGWLASDASGAGELIALIKPQFEAGPGAVGHKGVVRDPNVHARVCAEISHWWAGLPGWTVLGIAESPITGPEGNREFLIGARLAR